MASKLEEHEVFITESYGGGKTYAWIAAQLEAKGLKTTPQNVQQWLFRLAEKRLARQNRLNNSLHPAPPPEHPGPPEPIVTFEDLAEGREPYKSTRPSLPPPPVSFAIRTSITKPPATETEQKLADLAAAAGKAPGFTWKK